MNKFGKLTNLPSEPSEKRAMYVCLGFTRFNKTFKEPMIARSYADQRDAGSKILWVIEEKALMPLHSRLVR